MTINNNHFSNELNEKLSSAFTLSDMEIFVFPDLMYSLVLANIMSLVIWEWRKDSWFRNMKNKNFNYRVNRVKQFIIDNFIFNLDLETWGMTTKQKEMERFQNFIDMDVLRESNALFGYHGDKYYFDIDIRRHFGLDKYNDDIIPYWKTETVEAMNAFINRPEYNTGAGECVSLSALYAAALFIIAEIPLENIFLYATPLHSQNFIDIKGGVITNNRRILTKNMWYNGTSLTQKARRALENEKVTFVSHLTGFIHTIYEKATIDKGAYKTFKKSLSAYLNTHITPMIFTNFLRNHMKHRNLFQFMQIRQERKHYIEVEKIFHYEHSSKHSFTGNSRNALMKEIDGDEFSLCEINDRILLNDFEHFLTQNKKSTLEQLHQDMPKHFKPTSTEKIAEMFRDLHTFTRLSPRLPDSERNYQKQPVLEIITNENRHDIIQKVFRTTDYNPLSQLALYAYRDMDRIDWQPFIKAAVERNPVNLLALKGQNIPEAYRIINGLNNVSIYSENRLALPDEVWNFQSGDGIEKAILFAGFLVNEHKAKSVSININDKDVNLHLENRAFHFVSNKQLKKELRVG